LKVELRNTAGEMRVEKHLIVVAYSEMMLQACGQATKKFHCCCVVAYICQRYSRIDFRKHVFARRMVNHGTVCLLISINENIQNLATLKSFITSVSLTNFASLSF